MCPALCKVGHMLGRWYRRLLAPAPGRTYRRVKSPLKAAHNELANKPEEVPSSGEETNHIQTQKHTHTYTHILYTCIQTHTHAYAQPEGADALLCVGTEHTPLDTSSTSIQEPQRAAVTCPKPRPGVWEAAGLLPGLLAPGECRHPVLLLAPAFRTLCQLRH